MTGDSESAYSKLVDRVESSDLLAILVTVAVIYVLFTVAVFDQGLNSVVSTLRFVTFLGITYALVALALNLQWGYAGLFNIGVAGFMAVGLYTMLIAVNAPGGNPPGLGLPLPVGILAGVLMAGLVGVVAALPALRLRADYLAIVTLGFSEIIRLTFQSSALDSWLRESVGIGTGGGSGVITPQNPVRQLYYVDGTAGSGATAFGEFVFGITGPLEIRETVVIEWTYVLVLVAFLVVTYLLLDRLVNSPFGRVLKAIREDELVANSLGKNVDLMKIKVFAIGCALMGLAGILWFGNQGAISPSDFMPILTFYVFVAVIIGGSGSNTGSVIGGLVFAGILFEGPRRVGGVVRGRFDDSPSTFAEAVVSLDPVALLAFATDNVAALQFVLLGLVLIAIIHRRPEGIVGHRVEPAAATDISRRRGDGDE